MVDQKQPHSPRLKKSLWLITTKNSVTKTWEPWIQRYPLGLDFGTWHSVQSHKCCEPGRCQRIQFQLPGARLWQEVPDQIHQRSAGHGKEKLVCQYAKCAAAFSSPGDLSKHGPSKRSPSPVWSRAVVRSSHTGEVLNTISSVLMGHQSWCAFVFQRELYRYMEKPHWICCNISRSMIIDVAFALVIKNCKKN